MFVTYPPLYIFLFLFFILLLFYILIYLTQYTFYTFNLLLYLWLYSDLYYTIIFYIQYRTSYCIVYLCFTLCYFNMIIRNNNSNINRANFCDPTTFNIAYVSKRINESLNSHNGIGGSKYKPTLKQVKIKEVLDECLGKEGLDGI